MPITDKELLVICNLSNLKMEFANLKKEESKKETTDKNEDLSAEKILSNHTIYSLIKNELEGHKKREIIRKEKNFPQLFTDKMVYIFNENDLPIDLDEEKFAEKYKIEKEYSKENLGSFFRITDEEKFICYYNSKEDLICSAPFMMECFDSFEEGKGNDYNFLTEWEILFAGDNYSIGKETLDLTLKNLNSHNAFEINNSTIPSRDKVEKTLKKNGYISDIKEFINDSFGSEILGNISGKIKSKYLNEILELFAEDIELQNILTSLLDSKLEEYVKNHTYLSFFNFKVSLIDEGLKVIICKNKTKNTIVIAISNTKELQRIEEDLNNKIFPKELFALTIIYKDLREKYKNAHIVFTGLGTAGKLATIYGLYFNDCSKAFLLNKPLNIKSIYNFYFENWKASYNNINYLIIETDNTEIGKSLGIGLLTTCFIGGIIGGKLLLGYLSIFILIIKMIKGFYNNQEALENQRKTLKILLNANLIKNEDNILKIEDVIKDKNKQYSFKYIDTTGKEQIIDNLSIEIFLHLSLMEEISNYRLYKVIKNEKDNQNGGCDIFILKGTTSDIKIYIKNNHIVRAEQINTQNHYNLMGETLSISLYDEKRFFGTILYNLLLIYHKIQEGYSSKKYTGYYFENNILTSFKNLPTIFSREQSLSFKEILKLEGLYPPYLDSTCGNINCEKISDEYKASFIRSCFSCNDNLKEKNIDEKIKDEDYNSVPLAMSTPNDKETLNESILKIMESKGETIALSEHYKSTMKEFSENPKLIEKYYVIEENKYNKNTADLKLGIFNENKEFAPEKVGFAYSSLDRIKVGLTTIPIYFLDTIDVSSISTTKVCNGATLECSCGTSPKKLVVTSQSNYITEDSLVATKDDNVPLLNVGDFGACRCNDNKPCKNFISLGSWNGVSPNNTINGKNILLNTCTISCGAGGTITIKNSNCKSNAN